MQAAAKALAHLISCAGPPVKKAPVVGYRASGHVCFAGPIDRRTWPTDVLDGPRTLPAASEVRFLKKRAGLRDAPRAAAGWPGIRKSHRGTKGVAATAAQGTAKNENSHATALRVKRSPKAMLPRLARKDAC
jgi:hypothetical protein